MQTNCNHGLNPKLTYFELIDLFVIFDSLMQTELQVLVNATSGPDGGPHVDLDKLWKLNNVFLKVSKYSFKSN